MNGEVIRYNDLHKKRHDIYICILHHLSAQEDQWFIEAAELRKIMEDVGQMLQGFSST